MSVGGGNPINLITGNKYQEETDLAPLPGVLGLELKRYYNSLSSHPGIAGPQWRLSYETVLYDLGSQIQILQADGRRLNFAKVKGGPLCTSTQPADGQVRIERLPDGKSVYHWRWADGRTLSFMGGSSGGFPLHRISAATGEQVQLRYNPLGDLVGVTDPQGRSLTFLYGRAPAGQRAPLEGVDTPLGRVRYGHDKLGRLTEAAFLPRKDGGEGLGSPTVTRLYHYEEAHQAGNVYALTGISLRSPGAQDQRLSTYAYETSGAAILTTRGSPQARDAKGQVVPGTGIEQLQVRYESKPLAQEGAPDRSGEVQPRSFGRIVLTNALGKTTVLRSAVIGGQLRLIDSRGAGCSTCGPANVSYGYDREGRLIRTTQLSAEGAPLRSELHRYDTWGRLAETALQTYAKGKAQPPQWAQRLVYLDQSYADGSIALGQQPSRIEQPSVIAGRARATEIEYNDKGQVLRITERGWSPIDAEGKEYPTAIERSTVYRYATVNGRSVLSEIDGPLPNGPKGSPEDSDVTRFSWDDKGQAIIEALAPGGMQWRYARTAQGLLREQTLDDGFRRIQTRWEWAAFSVRSPQPLRIDRTAWLLNDGKPLASSRREQQVLQARYDAMGRRTAMLQDDEPGEEMRYDAVGRPQRLSDARGQTLSWAYDAEGRLLAELEQDPAGQVLHARAWLRDGQGRLLATLAPGRIEQLHGVLLPPGPAAAMAQQISLAASPVGAPRVRLKDDFGREVLQRDPEDGRTVTTFEAKVQDGRSVEVQRQRRTGLDDQSQTEESLTFDLAGRLIHRERGDAQARCMDQLRYEGRLLMQLQGCAADERFERDAFGLITRRQQLGVASQAAFTERYRYDERSRLSERVLPDGQVLRYSYAEGRAAIGNTAPQVSRLRPWLSRLHADHPRFAQTLLRWLPQAWSSDPLLNETRVAHLLHAPDQLEAITHGNGEKTAWVRPKGLPASAPRPQIVALAAHDELSERSALQAPTDVDAFGRQSRMVAASGPHKGRALQLRWNAQHQLASVHVEGGRVIADYAYDAAGNRVRKSVYDDQQRATVTLFRYDTQHRLIAIADGQGHVQRQLLYTDHRAHSALQGDEAFALHADWRGLPKRLSDAQATTRWEGRFTDGGQLRSAASPADPGLRLAGQVFDEETGLHYNVHRYYDPVNERYISPDPLGTPDGPARYAYVRGQPQEAIDPLGLFEIPKKFFSGDPLNSFYDLNNDGGHGDIVRVAFVQYQRSHGETFSNHFIDWVIRNNYHTDANGSDCYPLPWVNGGGQCNKKNHFDNPNDGPKYKDADMKELTPGYEDGKDDDWVTDSLNQIKANRMSYADAVYAKGGGVDISFMLSAFGQNTHALADFYAHSNWVDDTSRGGCVHNVSKDGRVTEDGYVPNGLAKREIWDETASGAIFTGTVAGKNQFCTGFAGDISCADKTTHGYWNKDSESSPGGNIAFKSEEPIYGWRVESYSGKPPKVDLDGESATFGDNWFGDAGVAEPSLKKGDRIYVKFQITNMHEYAMHLAVEHTIQEIGKFYDAAASVEIGGLKMTDIFKMDKATMNKNKVSYDGKHSKK